MERSGTGSLKEVDANAEGWVIWFKKWDIGMKWTRFQRWCHDLVSCTALFLSASELGLGVVLTNRMQMKSCWTSPRAWALRTLMAPAFPLLGHCPDCHSLKKPKVKDSGKRDPTIPAISAGPMLSVPVANQMQPQEWTLWTSAEGLSNQPTDRWNMNIYKIWYI